MKLQNYFLFYISLFSQGLTLDEFSTQRFLSHLESTNLQAPQSMPLDDQTHHDLINTHKTQLYHSNNTIAEHNAAKELLLLYHSFSSIEAINVLADYFYGQKCDFDIGIRLYEAGVKINSPHCLFKLAGIYLSKGQKDKAHAVLQKGVSLQDNYCLCLLAQRILDGTFAQYDHTDAQQFFKLSADQGFTVAITELAKYHTDNKYGTPHYLLAYSLLSTIKDDNRARQDLAKIVDQEVIRLYEANDFLSLAKLYYIGKNAPQNNNLAIEFIKAARTRQDISDTKASYYTKLIGQGKPWEEPSFIDLVLTKIF